MATRRVGKPRGLLGQLLAITAIVVAGVAYWVATRPAEQRDEGRLGYDPLRYDKTQSATRIAEEVEAAAILFDFEEARGFDLGPDGTAYIVGDTGLVAIGPDGEKLAGFDVGGNAQSVSLGPDGKLYICLEVRVVVYSVDGARLAAWESPGEDAYLRCIAVNDTHAFVTDFGHRVAYRYALDGTLEGRIGQKDPDTGERGYVIPSPYIELAIAGNDTLWVVDPGRHELINYDFYGTRISSWSAAGMTVEGFCGCCNPTHFAILPNGGFLTSEKGIARVKVYDRTGSLIGVVAGPDDFEPDVRGLDLHVDPQGRYMVLDPIRQQIRVFKPTNPEG